jgi:hypothetical protein
VRLGLILVARRRDHDRVGLLAYPCEDCRNTVPIYYCDACRGQYENDTTDQKLIAHFEAMEQFVSNRTDHEDHRGNRNEMRRARPDHRRIFGGQKCAGRLVPSLRSTL